MPKLNEIIPVIESVAPPGLAEAWDNSGLQFGHPDAVIRRIMVGLDPTPEAVREAAEFGAGLLLTHHPFFFGTVKRLDFGYGQGEALAFAVRAGLAVYSAHTSFDSANPGVSDSLADVLGLLDRRPLEPARGRTDGAGLGRVGRLPSEVTALEAAEAIKEDLGCAYVRLVGDPGRTVRSAAFCGGSGGSLIDKVIETGADLYVTGDVKYHEALRALEAGLIVIDVGHYHSERFAMPMLARLISDGLAAAGLEVEVAVSGLSAEPWREV